MAALAATMILASDDGLTIYLSNEKMIKCEKDSPDKSGPSLSRNL